MKLERLDELLRGPLGSVVMILCLLFLLKQIYQTKFHADDGRAFFLRNGKILLLVILIGFLPPLTQAGWHYLTGYEAVFNKGAD